MMYLDDSEETIGERLREAVAAAGGPSSVARQAGMVPQTLNKYMRGTALRLSVAARLARICQVNLEWLATGGGAMRPQGAADYVRETIRFLDVDPRALAEALLYTDAARGPNGSLITPRGKAAVLIAYYDVLMAQSVGARIAAQQRLDAAMVYARRCVDSPTGDGDEDA